MERGGDGIALGVAIVPRWRPTQRQHGIEVADGSRADVFRRHGGEREVEENNLQRVILGDAADGHVVGLDVAVRYALLVEMPHDVDQILAKPLQEIDVEAALLADSAPERFDPLIIGVGEHRSHQKASVVADLEGLNEAHDPVVAVVCQPGEGCRLVAETVVVLGRGGDLENEPLRVSGIGCGSPRDQQRRRTGALPDPPLHTQATRQEIAGDSVGGIQRVFLAGARELIFGIVQQRQEFADRIKTV